MNTVKPQKATNWSLVVGASLEFGVGSLEFLILLLLALTSSSAAPTHAVSDFTTRIQPLLSTYCYDCHGDGAKKGGIAYDELKTDDEILNHDLWLRVLKNTRAGLMPPLNKPRPTAEEQKTLDHWIKYEAFGIDPKNPDPGRVTVRRLNRVEYRNTVRDLLGVDFHTEYEFPPDDTGYGFDNIGDVLSVSPLLLEKYMNAAREVVSEAFGNTEQPKAEKYHPHESDQAATRTAEAGAFDVSAWRAGFRLAGSDKSRQQELVRAAVTNFAFLAYRRPVDGDTIERLMKLVKKVSKQKSNKSESALTSSLSHEERDEFEEGIKQAFVAILSSPRFLFRLEPDAAPAEASDPYGVRWQSEAPTPLSGASQSREKVSPVGVAQSPKAASPSGRSSGQTLPPQSKNAVFDAVVTPSAHAVDEFSLASRLSYFLWSTMPDSELFSLASQNQLRVHLRAQVARMLKDKRSDQFVKNFTGQWLQIRDVEGIAINERAVLARDRGGEKEMERLREQLHALRDKINAEGDPGGTNQAAREKLHAQLKALADVDFELDPEIRHAMQRETQLCFRTVLRENRPVTELIESDYTFLNKKLAEFYGLTNLGATNEEMRRVELPRDSPRGGVLTDASVLLVTSNPDRTSPVKRGFFILDNILNTPTPPPPANLPPLERAENSFHGQEPTLRQALEVHRDKPLCMSCHSRMDPLGLAFENFNAMGMWRDKERNQTIEAAGKLVTGETFDNVRKLKHILVTSRKLDFYRCLAEKMLTYALGRGLEYYDVETVDQIVERLKSEDGKMSALIAGITESAPFQRTRNADWKSAVPQTGSLPGQPDEPKRRAAVSDNPSKPPSS